MIASSNAAAPTVADQASVLNLHSSVKAMSTAVAELRTAAAKVSVLVSARVSVLFSAKVSVLFSTTVSALFSAKSCGSKQQLLRSVFYSLPRSCDRRCLLPKSLIFNAKVT